jgi:polysaccharide deacetylase family protein (PEP-CTERM system associated)
MLKQEPVRVDSLVAPVRSDAVPAGDPEERPSPGLSVVISFDVEEHDKIEAAAGWRCPSELRRVYADRMASATRRLLERLAAAETPATFFVLGRIAAANPGLIREIAEAGHEVASHGWDHQRVHRLTPASFRHDVRRSKDELEQVSGREVRGYRAPTFSIVRETGWAIDVLAECGMAYDSSIFPVRHDRYGIPSAPRGPFRAEGHSTSIIELPLATFRVLGQNLPVAGGGYFRLFPLAALRAGIAQLGRRTSPAVGMLYFHPWEFDPGQPRIPLNRVSKWRTYVGIEKAEARMDRLLRLYRFRRAIDVVGDLSARSDTLPRFRVPVAGHTT